MTETMVFYICTTVGAVAAIAGLVAICWILANYD